MYTIISGTNRIGSYSKKVALEYQHIMKEMGISTGLLSLDEVDITSMDKGLERVQNEILIPTLKFIFIIPEYNGSYPGILKLMIDQSDIQKCWWHKKALMTGVSTGRAGNLRGMDHLTDSLLYLKMQVHYNRLPISIIDKLMDEDAAFNDEGTIRAIHKQLEEFILF
jgi:NAD(P)H-dependent FMN reductase